MTTNHQEDAMTTTIATTKPEPYTPPAGDAGRDPLRERDLASLGIVGAEVTTTGLSEVTVRMSTAQLDTVINLAADEDDDDLHDCSEACDRSHVEDLTAADAIALIADWHRHGGLTANEAWAVVHLADDLRAQP